MSLLQITINAGTPADFREAIAALAAGVGGAAITTATEAAADKPARTRRTREQIEADAAAEKGETAEKADKTEKAEKPAGKPAAAEKAALRSRGAIVDEPPADEDDTGSKTDTSDDEDDDLGAKPVDVEALKADLQAIRAHSAPALADLLQKHGGSPKFREVKETSYAAIQAAASAYIKKHDLSV